MFSIKKGKINVIAHLVFDLQGNRRHQNQGQVFLSPVRVSKQRRRSSTTIRSHGLDMWSHSAKPYLTKPMGRHEAHA